MCDELHDPFEDQVECARYKAERDALAQAMERVADDIEWTFLGYEGVEDAPAMRWARQFRAALGSLHAPVRDATMSACDLTPDEDREAAEWVRERGGLENVRDAWDEAVNLCTTIGCEPNDESEMLQALGDCTDIVIKRLMPESMEWPKHTDGELVRIGGCWGEDGCDTSITYIERIIFAEDGVYLDNEYNEAFYRHGERVKRPAPKVLDADGVEIRVGDRLYDTDTGCGRTVRAVNDNGTVEFDGHENRGWFAKFLTHRAPVLAADGEPLREGEHVYHVETGAELVVKKLPKPGEYQAVVVFALPTSPASHLTSFDPDRLTHRAPVLAADGEPLEAGQTVWDANGDEFRVLGLYGGPVDEDFPDHAVRCRRAGAEDYESTMCAPSQLTHTKPEPPDSWERVEDDCSISERDYYAQLIGHDVGLKDDEEVHRAVSLDLVRRCKALAERDGS